MNARVLINGRPQQAQINSRPRQAGAYLWLAACWLLASVLSELRLTDSFAIKLVILVVPAVVSLLAVLVNPAQGYALWSLVFGLLLTHTGYQADLGPLRFSALEAALVGLLFLLVWLSSRSVPFRWRLMLPGSAPLTLFILYSSGVLLAGWLGGGDITRELYEFKGFILYPLIAVVMVFGLQNIRLLRLALLLVVPWYLYLAGVGILQFLTGTAAAAGDQIVRVDAGYAPINTYGITLAAVAVLMLGVALASQTRGMRIGGLLASFWLFLGAAGSVSRAVWIAFAAGLLVLFFTGAGRRAGLPYLLTLLVAIVTLFALLPPEVSGRILQLSNSSTVERAFYLDSGWHALLDRVLIGWGWGNAFWYYPQIGLVPTGNIPWYHNDYLNLAVQTGVVGLGLYLAFWLRVLRTGVQWLHGHTAMEQTGFVRGGLAGLVVLLVAATFEHVLWRPDIGGLVGWMLGILVAGMALAGHQNAGQDQPA